MKTITYTCDRCGKQFDHSHYPHEWVSKCKRGGYRTPNRGIMMDLSFRKNITQIDEQEADLCFDCVCTAVFELAQAYEKIRANQGL